MKKSIIVLLVLTFTVCGLYAKEKRAIQFEDLWGMKRVSSPKVSPDGKSIAYVITEYNVEENKGNSDIWIISVNGGTAKQLTNSPQSDNQPAWSPDGTKIAFISSRNGSPQIYTISMLGGEAKQITDFPTGASSPVWSPDGNSILFTSEVYPECKNEEELRERVEKEENKKSKSKLITGLMYRHWNYWRDGKRNHIYIVSSEGGVARDLTPWDYDAPTIALGSGNDVAFSTDGDEIAFVMNKAPMVTISTNNDIFTMKLYDGEPQKLTENKANDNQPVYSPDGRYIAYRKMMRPGFEADRYRLIIYDRKSKTKVNLTEELDYSISEIVWSPDSKKIFFNAEDEGRISIFSLDIATKKVVKLLKEFCYSLNVTSDGSKLIFCMQKINLPAELFSINTDGTELTQLTYTNKERLSELEMNPMDEFWFTGAKGEKVHGLMVKPPFFNPKKKYPLVYLIHGGPQGSWGDDFHYRWNAQMFAAPGYVVVMVNFHGSTGYGQDFTDSITGNWGGHPYNDLMKGLDYVLANYKFIDKNRIGAAGASYGGFMINWIEGHTDRFNCLVSHDGVYNPKTEYGTTDELWFPEWEFGGTPWDKPELYDKWNPSKFVKNFKTPMLVIHGQLDYRCDVSVGFSVFTHLQRQGVPSKFLYFPDEGHFVLKPQNAKVWWNTIYEWFAEYLKK